MAYQAYLLDEADKAKLMALYPPKFANVIAHHCTVKFGVPSDAPLPDEATLEVVGYTCDDSLECLVVAVNDCVYKPGGIYHITWSLEDGRKPVESNELLNYGYTIKHKSKIKCIPVVLK